MLETSSHVAEVMMLKPARSSSLPRHIAIIPDGNRRWAQREGLPPEMGHGRGFLEVSPALFRKAWERGVHTMTLWMFSTENWSRSDREVAYLMDIYTQFVEMMTDICVELDVRIHHLGRADRLPQHLQVAVTDALHKTRNCVSGVFNMALDYGGRDELVRATARLLKAGIDPDSIDEMTLRCALDTSSQPYGEPDIILRTSGEQRLSGFMPWQSTYSEFFFVDIFYPDLNWAIVERTISSYTARNRRFGGDLSSQSGVMPMVSEMSMGHSGAIMLDAANQ
jgi:undecaprenyl diphosphate synthase